MQGEPPAVARRRVRLALRRFRGHSNMSQTEVAGRLGWSLSKMQRIELGEVGVSPTDLRALLQLYGVEDTQETARLIDDARTSRRQRWWMGPEYRQSLTAGLRLLLQFESEATAIRVYQPFLVPGILQTAAFAEHVLAWLDESLTDEERTVRLGVRMLRKEVLRREGAPEYFLIVDEAVLLRKVGGAKTMAEQLEELAEASRLPNIHIRVIPLAQGAHAGILGPFQILSLGDDDEDAVLYQESYIRDSVSHVREEIDFRRMIFEKLWVQSRDEDVTRRAIIAAAARLRSELDQ